MAADVPAFLRPLRALRSPPPLAAGIVLEGRRNPLPFAMPRQQLPQWCWAATTEGVQAYYREPFARSQCEIASFWLGLPCCPPRPEHDTPYDLQTVLEGNLAAPVHHGALPLGDVTREIDDGRPICCAIEWRSGELHFNAIIGYVGGPSAELIVRDPKYGAAQLSYHEFSNRYRGEGRWVAALRTRKA